MGCPRKHHRVRHLRSCRVLLLNSRRGLCPYAWLQTQNEEPTHPPPKLVAGVCYLLAAIRRGTIRPTPARARHLQSPVVCWYINCHFFGHVCVWCPKIPSTDHQPNVVL